MELLLLLLLLLPTFRRGVFLRCLVLLFLSLNCFEVLKSEAQFLPDDEVQALQEVARKLRNRYWNVDKTFCSGDKGSNITMAPVILSNVTCDCTFNNFTLCHVTNIQLKGLNLTGVLPEEFAKLHYLQEIDLSINYLDGSIPKSWASLPLVTLSLLGNRITGTIPKELGDIITLELLVLSDNRLEGSLPPEIGKLTRLMRFSVSANNVTGKLPETFGNLRNLTAFRIDGTGISGRIPSFIGNWSKLTILDLEGTSMTGPFPSTISLLQNLTNLRVSDLNGLSMAFPELQGMKYMRELVLRNCMITGKIPLYIGETMTKLKILDLSFNRLVGEIPANFQKLSYIEFMYLSSNSLTGMIPSSILDHKEYIDISYNNFTGPPQSSCQQPNVKRISSYFSSDDKSISWCLRKGLPCSKKPEYYSFFINCGGPKQTFEGKTYEEDLATMGASYFFSTERWAYSSTGSFLGRQEANYLARNASVLQMAHPELYMTARLSPLSLRYYGLCLRKGSYKVRLHFAEIIFTDDQTFSSLGKRIFDVSIQGETFLRDFNIAEEAKGVGRSITKEFNVLVTGSTLEIHLFWRGKGTNDIPDKGVHGPIISSITVTPNFDPHAKLSVRAIVAMVCGSVIILLIVGLVGFKCYQSQKNLDNEELRSLELRTFHINSRQIKAATRNFDPANKIGEGGFGPVYKGILSNGATIAVKQLSSKSKQGNREFLNEIGIISAIEHPNLVKLYGCCIDGNQLFLIYEYMENNSLANALFGGEDRLHLDWPARYKICLDIARGLAYLHEESRLKIVHRDIKATNVLLDKDLNAKISDFGLARLDDEEKSHITSRIAGTIGYMAPEYAMRGYLSKKADVYSFGILTLEIVSGKRNSDYMPMESSFSLVDWVNSLDGQGNLLELIDRSLGSNYSREEAMKILKLVLLCTDLSPSLRPIMSDVVRVLDGQMTLQELTAKGESSTTENRLEASAEVTTGSQTETTSFSQDTSIDRSS